MVGEDYPDADLRKVCPVPPAPLKCWRAGVHVVCKLHIGNLLPVRSPWRNAQGVGDGICLLRLACLNMTIEFAIINFMCVH